MNIFIFMYMPSNNHLVLFQLLNNIASQLNKTMKSANLTLENSRLLLKISIDAKSKP